jgi:hypothetical protein
VRLRARGSFCGATTSHRLPNPREELQMYRMASLLAACLAIAAVLMSAAPGGSAVGLVTLTVPRLGTGTGSLTSNPAGLICMTTCTGKFTVGTRVTLIAQAGAGSSTDGYSTNCEPIHPPKLPPGPNIWGARCQVTLSADKAVKAIFNLTSTPCSVPRLKGRTVARAIFLLALDSCRTGSSWSRRSSTVKKGRVLTTFPQAGWHGDHDASVNLILSGGRR